LNEPGIGIEIDESGDFLVPGQLNLRFKMTGNFSNKKQKIMIEIIGFPDAEEHLLFRWSNGIISGFIMSIK
jgi:hypothetical protein